MTLTLNQADAIIDGALAFAEAESYDPLTIAVLDAGGHLIAFKRTDNSGILRPEIAMGKAYGALGFGLDSRDLKDKNAIFLNAIAAASHGKLVPVPGGVLIRDAKSQLIMGAIGVSGDNSWNDEKAAVVGIESAGLTVSPALKD